MPFRPHTYAFKLRSLFDAKVCTPQDVARSTGLSLVSIDRILRGWKPSQQAAHDLDKFLSYHKRKRDRFLKLEDSDENLPPSPPTRGIHEVRYEFPGIRCFHVVSSKGEKRLQVIAPAGDVNELLVEFMNEWLNDVDPQISLVEDGPTSS